MVVEEKVGTGGAQQVMEEEALIVNFGMYGTLLLINMFM